MLPHRWQTACVTLCTRGVSSTQTFASWKNKNKIRRSNSLTRVWSCSLICILLLLQDSESEKPNCKACDPSCEGCHGPSMRDCTLCPASQILSDDGRCLSCCGNETLQNDKPISRECCDCKSSTGKQDEHCNAEGAMRPLVTFISANSWGSCRICAQKQYACSIMETCWM